VKLRYTRQAARDLIEIAEYLRARNLAAALAVRAAILRSLRDLILFPALGRRQTIEGVRKLVTRKYRYLIYYTVDEGAQEVVILTIRHPSRGRVYSDT
jgi:plasmid stabilization system protein ParE